MVDVNFSRILQLNYLSQKNLRSQGLKFKDFKSCSEAYLGLKAIKLFLSPKKVIFYKW